MLLLDVRGSYKLLAYLIHLPPVNQRPHVPILSLLLSWSLIAQPFFHESMNPIRFAETRMEN